MVVLFFRTRQVYERLTQRCTSRTTADIVRRWAAADGTTVTNSISLSVFYTTLQQEHELQRCKT